MKTKQGTLWETLPLSSDGARLPPATAKADPDTSAAAEAAVTESGQRTRNVNRVVELVRNQPKSTSVELWKDQAWQPGCLDRHEVSRRLSDAMRLGLVFQGEARECRVNGTRMVTWEPVTEGDHG